MRLSTFFLLLGFVFLLIGCGSQPTFDKYVKGEVTYDGKPIGDGNITFKNKDGKGAPSSCTIKGGMFSLEAPPGSYTVDVESPEIKVGGGKKTVDFDVAAGGPKIIKVELKSK